MAYAYDLHADAEALAKHLCKESPNAIPGERLFQTPELLEPLELSAEQMVLAVDELIELGYVTPHRALGDGGPKIIAPTMKFFFEFDALVFHRDVEVDALSVAISLQKHVGGVASAQLAAELSWDPRRYNPAIALLIDDGHAENERSRVEYPFIFQRVRPNAATHRFVRDAQR